MVWLPEGEKKLNILYSFWQNAQTWQTDKRTPQVHYTDAAARHQMTAGGLQFSSFSNFLDRVCAVTKANGCMSGARCCVSFASRLAAARCWLASTLLRSVGRHLCSKLVFCIFEAVKLTMSYWLLLSIVDVIVKLHTENFNRNVRN